MIRIWICFKDWSDQGMILNADEFDKQSYYFFLDRKFNWMFIPGKRLNFKSVLGLCWVVNLVILEQKIRKVKYLTLWDSC